MFAVLLTAADLIFLSQVRDLIEANRKCDEQGIIKLTANYHKCEGNIFMLQVNIVGS